MKSLNDESLIRLANHLSKRAQEDSDDIFAKPIREQQETEEVEEDIDESEAKYYDEDLMPWEGGVEDEDEHYDALRKFIRGKAGKKVRTGQHRINPIDDEPGIMLYKPNGNNEYYEDKVWTWEEIQNWAEGNISVRDLHDWVFKARKSFEDGDGWTVGKMIYEILYKNSRKAQQNNSFTFNVSPSNDSGAVGGSDSVTVIVDSGNPGGDPGEFEQYMQKVLSDWFDSEVTVG